MIAAYYTPRWRRGSKSLAISDFRTAVREMREPAGGFGARLLYA
jgi:hypothetical protein